MSNVAAAKLETENDFYKKEIFSGYKLRKRAGT